MEYFKTEFSFFASEIVSLIQLEGGAALLLILLTALAIYAGASIAFSLFGTAAFFAGFALVSGNITGDVFSSFAPELEAFFSSHSLVAVPLFLFTALVIERAFIVEDLIEKLINHWKQKSEAMLFTVSLMDILISILVATIGLLMAPLGALRLPLLLKSKNHIFLNKEAISKIFQKGPLSYASFMTLPVMMILLAEQLTKISKEISHIASGQSAKSPELLLTLTTMDLIIAALIPGLILVVLYGLYQLALLFKAPNEYVYKKPATLEEANQSTIADLFRALLPLVLYLCVLIFSALFAKLSIAELSSLAAIGAILLASQKLAPSKNKIYLNSVISFFGLCIVSQFFPLNIMSFKLSPWNGAGLAIAMFFIGYLTYGLYHAIKELCFVQLKSEDNNKPLSNISFMETLLREAYSHTVKVITLLIAASFYLIVFKALGADSLIKAGLENVVELKGFVLVLSLFIMILTAKFFSPYIAILVAMPMFMPHIFALTNMPANSTNLLWLGIVIIISMQITIYLFLPLEKHDEKQKAQNEVVIFHEQIHQTKIPFIVFHIVILVLIGFFPGIVNWLGNAI